MSKKIKPIPVADSRDPKTWHRGRTTGVTNTDVVRLMTGTLATNRAVHADKTGDKPRFGGNDATKRGHAFEAAIASWVLAEYGIPASGVLYAHGENRRHLATPDCFVWDEGEGALVEIKTTTEDWSAGLPRKIVLDVLWQRYVLGAGFSAVAWQRFDEDGMPLTLQPEFVEVPDDLDLMTELIHAADAYLTWVDDGRPELDTDVPADIRDAAEELAAAKALIAEKEPIVKAWALSVPGADTAGVKREIPGATIALTVTHGREFDEPAARAAYAGFFQVLDEHLDRLAAIKKEHMKPRVGQRFSIAAPKTKEPA